MNKKFIVILFTFSLLITLSSCMNERKLEVVNDESLLDLSLSTFGEIYNLSEEVEFTSIQLRNLNTQTWVQKLTHEQFKDVYTRLIEVKCENSSKNKSHTTKGRSEHVIIFGVKEEEDNRGFQITLYESYLLVQLLGDEGNYLYKHEINEDDYTKIKSMLNVLKSSVYEVDE